MTPESKVDTVASFLSRTPSGLIAVGDWELKLFNNLYTQTAFFDAEGIRRDEAVRRSWFTGLIRLQYGLISRVELGLDAHYRRSRYAHKDENPLFIFQDGKDSISNSGLSKIGFNIRWQPFSSTTFLSTRFSYLVPILAESKRSSQRPFLDSDRHSMGLELLYDKELIQDIWIFASLLNNIELGKVGEDEILRTPLNLIFSYRKNTNWSPYVLGEFAPVWGDELFSSQYVQFGAGIKLYPSERIELEVLYSNFVIGRNAGAGQTFNLGFRNSF